MRAWEIEEEAIRVKTENVLKSVAQRLLRDGGTPAEIHAPRERRKSKKPA
jgi:hypothetical protein